MNPLDVKVCEWCGGDFFRDRDPRPTFQKRRRFCSLSCSSRSRHPVKGTDYEDPARPPFVLVGDVDVVNVADIWSLR